MVKFYNAYCDDDDCFYIIISNEQPEIGETYIGWKPTWLGTYSEFGKLAGRSDKKLIPWKYFFNHYYLHRELINIKLIGTVDSKNRDWYLNSSRLTEWLNDKVNIPKVFENKQLNYSIRTIQAKYIIYND